MLATEFHRILQLGNKNLLLFCVFIAIALGVRLPLSQEMLHSFNFTTPLVAYIFIAQGVNMDFTHASKIKKYIKILVAGTLIAVVAYPALAFAFTHIFFSYKRLCPWVHSYLLLSELTRSGYGNDHECQW